MSQWLPSLFLPLLFLTLEDYEVCQAPAVFPLLLYRLMDVSARGPFLRFPSYLVIGWAWHYFYVNQPLQGAFTILWARTSTGLLFTSVYRTFIFTSPKVVITHSLLSAHHLLGVSLLSGSHGPHNPRLALYSIQEGSPLSPSHTCCI